MPERSPGFAFWPAATRHQHGTSQHLFDSDASLLRRLMTPAGYVHAIGNMDMPTAELLILGIGFGVVLPFAIWAIMAMKQAAHHGLDDLD